MKRDSHSALPSDGGQRTQITRRAVSIAGFRDPAEVAAVFKQDGPKDLSTFYGIHVLNALAKFGDIDTGLDFISRYSGGMPDFVAHRYVGFRQSFCHGGAGGPTAWLSRNVLGISPAAPGFIVAREMEVMLLSTGGLLSPLSRLDGGGSEETHRSVTLDCWG